MKQDLNAPIYDIDKSYLENAENGPFFHGEIPSRAYRGSYDFLGYPVASRIGVPAGPLLNSKWIKLAADLQYDILCYKTIRTKEFNGHPVPNVVYIDSSIQLSPNSGTITQMTAPPTAIDALGITNSFGMPSRSKKYLLEDIPKGNNALHPGQVMIVSAVGSSESPDFFRDFVDAALLAKECGAHIIEVNYSCPNVGVKEGSLYLDPEAVFTLTKQIKQAIQKTPLIIKVGCFPNKELLTTVLTAAARAGASAVSGINSISKNVVAKSGSPALGQGRLLSGICGAPIRKAALQFISASRTVIDREKLDLCLIGCGGITLPEHFNEFYDAGADFAMTATAMMWNPYLAIQTHKESACTTKT